MPSELAAPAVEDVAADGDGHDRGARRKGGAPVRAETAHADRGTAGVRYAKQLRAPAAVEHQDVPWTVDAAARRAPAPRSRHQRHEHLATVGRQAGSEVRSRDPGRRVEEGESRIVRVPRPRREAVHRPGHDGGSEPPERGARARPLPAARHEQLAAQLGEGGARPLLHVHRLRLGGHGALSRIEQAEDGAKQHHDNGHGDDGLEQHQPWLRRTSLTPAKLPTRPSGRAADCGAGVSRSEKSQRR